MVIVAQAPAAAPDGPSVLFLLGFALAALAVGQYFVVRCPAAYLRVRRASEDGQGDGTEAALGRVFVFGRGVLPRKVGSTTYVFIGSNRIRLVLEEVQLLRTSRTTIERDEIDRLRWSEVDGSASLEVVRAGVAEPLLRGRSVAAVVSVLISQGWPAEPAAG